jgi:hypothetical protein
MGALVWWVWLIVNRPALAAANWAEAMVLLAALVHVPLGLMLVASQTVDWHRHIVNRIAVWLQFPAALILMASFEQSMGATAAAFALPWLAVTMLISFSGAMRLVRGEWNDVREFAANVGCVYIAVGGMWCAISRSGWRPWDFDALIVLMTAVHFHFAAFVLPIVAGRVLAAKLPARIARIAAVILLSAIPLLAVAITATHFHYSPVIEWCAACLMSTAGLLVAVLHLRLAISAGRPLISRILWAIAGASLIFGMLLAASYGLREANIFPRMEIPAMIATHGTVNALGFCLCTLLGWLWHDINSKSQRRFQASGERKLPGEFLNGNVKSKTQIDQPAYTGRSPVNSQSKWLD